MSAALSEPAPAQLIYIPPANLAGVWSEIAHLVPSVIERSRGRLTLDNVVDAIGTGAISLFIVWDGSEALAVVGLKIGIAPSGMKVGTVQYASGRDSQRWIHLLDDLEGYARQSGCQVLEVIARKGWEKKLPSYKRTHVFLEKAL
jgi:hypothetical protein